MRAIFFLLLLAAPCFAQDEPAELPQWGKGPFEVSDTSILGELRLDPYARSPRTLEPGVVELGARGSMESTFSWLDEDPAAPFQPPVRRVTIAGETRDLALVLRAGVFPRVELGAELSVLHWVGGGILDGLIRNWHVLVGTGALGRNNTRRDAYVADATEPSGNRIQLPGPLTGLGDGSASVRVLALIGSDCWPAVAITLRTWIPLSNRHFEHAHGTAESLSIDLSKRVLSLPLFVYASGAYTYYDESTVAGLHLERHRFMGAIGVEWEIHPTVSAVVHFFEETRRETKLYRHTDLPYGNYIQYIAFGFKLEPLPGLRIEIGAIEHILDPNVTGTFGFLLNVWWEFDAGELVRSAP